MAAEGRATEEFTDLWLELLIRFLLREQCVLEVMRLLISVHSDERELPEKLCAVDDNGHTFATWWLSGFLVGQFHQRKTPGKVLLYLIASIVGNLFPNNHNTPSLFLMSKTNYSTSIFYYHYGHAILKSEDGV